MAWLMMACVDITPTPQIDASADDGDQGDDGTSEAGDDGSSTDAGAPVQDEAEAAAYDE